MKTQKIKGLELNVGNSNAFAYETDPMLPKLHQNILFVAKRGGGKTVSCVNLMEWFKFDRIFCVSPSVKSNKEMMDRLNIDPDDIFEDVDDISCLQKIRDAIDQERDDLVEALAKLEKWKTLDKKITNRIPLKDEDDHILLDLFNSQTNQFEKPTHRWNFKRPKIAILFDDCVGSGIYTKGIKKLNNMTILHRHLGQFDDGGAIGASLFFLVQSYKCQNGGLSKCIRNNITSICLFKTKSEKELVEIAEEVSGEIDTDTFYKLYDYATDEPHSFLFIDLHKKSEHPSGFRKRFSEFLIPSEINKLDKVKDGSVLQGAPDALQRTQKSTKSKGSSNTPESSKK
jgi:hypothetical protein